VLIMSAPALPPPTLGPAGLQGGPGAPNLYPTHPTPHPLSPGPAVPALRVGVVLGFDGGRLPPGGWPFVGRPRVWAMLGPGAA